MQKNNMHDELESIEENFTYQYFDHPRGGQILIPFYKGKPLGCLKKSGGLGRLV
jgi:hypothetical protein